MIGKLQCILLLPQGTMLESLWFLIYINDLFIIEKLEIVGISGLALKRPVDYLKNRKQLVKLNDRKNTKHSVVTGVPQ